ncbi:MAG: hypothetical protein AAF555_01775 [Verrucomicrobiota bacterium]
MAKAPVLRQHARFFRHPGRLILICWLHAFSRLAMLGAIASVVLIFVADRKNLVFGFFGGLVLFGVFSLWEYLISRKVRCGLCQANVLGHTMNVINRDARKHGPLSYRSSCMIDIITTGRFVCPHCGTPYRTRE